ncbi:UbiC transcription regulator-associated domain protein [Bordetella bronchiseptica 99-R-0433]|uniref:GntR family transcriptional regulator n=1 Tax=Bordetella bronchiseptica TaxID=518 RepID=UPI00045B68F7|nr:GntR family transcriptional regulator [Bordetella bronchiseptica]KCV65722.1 UbiC transcription regulator-associated domain protein [Bordetella bronchiseptica 99-R-0433]
MAQMKDTNVSNRATLVLYENRSIPLYRMIKEELIRFVQKKGIKSGMALPGDNELASQFGVSVGTVRRAIAELVSERIVIRQQGRGTFLAPYDTSRMLNSFWHIERRDGVVDVPLVSTHGFSQAQATEEVAQKLALQPGDPVFVIRNSMTMQGTPVLLDTIYVPVRTFEGLTREKLSARDATIYDFYREQYGINIVKTIDRVSATVADKDSAKRLGCKLGAPMLRILRVAYSFGDTPIEYRCSLLDSENHEYVDVTGGDTTRYG